MDLVEVLKNVSIYVNNSSLKGEQKKQTLDFDHWRKEDNTELSVQEYHEGSIKSNNST